MLRRGVGWILEIEVAKPLYALGVGYSLLLHIFLQKVGQKDDLDNNSTNANRLNLNCERVAPLGNPSEGPRTPSSIILLLRLLCGEENPAAQSEY